MGNTITKKNPTGIVDMRGNMIHFGDKMRFVDKVEWYGREYMIKVASGKMTREAALREIELLPYEERVIKTVQDYEWLLSSEIQDYWEIVP